jgi:hypothetical protein
MNNLEKEIRYAVFTPVFGVRLDRKKNKNHKRSQKARRLLMILFMKRKNQIFRY